MSEAKLRGSFEERKAMAAERKRKAQQERAKRDALRPRGKSRLSSLLVATLAAAAGSVISIKK
jgi:hypothetical protein